MASWMLNLKINRDSGVPIYRQIVFAFVGLIQGGKLTSGTAIPGTRQLAKSLSINRNTVVQAYDELSAQGWIAFRHGSTPIVSTSIESINLLKSPTPSRSKSTSEKINAEKLILNDGYPDSRLFPNHVFSRTFGRITRQSGHKLFASNEDLSGYIGLRKSVARMLQLRRGMKLNEDELVITRGSQQAIFLIGLTLSKLNYRNILVESPGYGPAKKAFEAVGLRVTGVPVDCDGIKVDMIESKLLAGEKISAIYITPHHQYPTTVTLKANRRARLLSLAEKYDFWILEDDYDHDFHYDSSPIYPLASSESQKIIYFSSLSKVLSVGLRIGYVHAPDVILRELLQMKSLLDRVGDVLLEKTIAELMDEGEIQKHINRMRKIYKERRDYLMAGLENIFPDLSPPSGGMGLWLTLDATSCKRLNKALITSGILPVNVEQFTTMSPPPGARIGFASLNNEEADKLLTTMQNALR